MDRRHDPGIAGLFGRLRDRDRVAHLRPFPLPGGEQAIKEPRRAAIGVLYEMLAGSNPFVRPSMVETMDAVGEAVSEGDSFVDLGFLGYDRPAVPLSFTAA